MKKAKAKKKATTPKRKQRGSKLSDLEVSIIWMVGSILLRQFIVGIGKPTKPDRKRTAKEWAAVGKLPDGRRCLFCKQDHGDFGLCKKESDRKRCDEFFRGAK